MEAKTKSEKTAMAKATKEMNKKKAEMEKQASRDFQDWRNLGYELYKMYAVKPRLPFVVFSTS